MLKNIIIILPVIIALLVFALVISIARSYHPGKVVYRTYIKINNTLKEKKTGFFDYEKTNDFLTANGAVFHYGRWIEPVKYLVLQICLAAVLFILGMRFHFLMAIIFFVAGFALPGMLLIYLNKADNQKMMKDIQLLYDSLQVQIKSGVYVSDALSESYRNIEKGRLRTALEELAGELYMKNSIAECVSHFNKKFNSPFIDSLCVILNQAQESGQAADLLKDMAAQIDDMRSALQMKRKEQLNRVTTFCLMGIMASILGVVVYACMMTMFHSASSL